MKTLYYKKSEKAPTSAAFACKVTEEGGVKTLHCYWENLSTTTSYYPAWDKNFETVYEKVTRAEFLALFL